MKHGVNYRIDEEGIAVLEFDLPDKKVNLLSTPVLDRLEQIIEELGERNDVKAALIVSAKEDVFIAGADVAEITAIKEAGEGEQKAAKGQAILQALNALKFPVIAAIDGICLGGGTELALACHYRIASDSDKTNIGLPEVNLGILPGFGGTQRLPKLIGIQAALDMILSGRPVDARKALQTRLVDQLVPKNTMVQEALRFVRALLDGKPPARKKRRDLKTFLLEGNFLGKRILFSQARQRVLRRTKGHYPAPLKALEAVERGIPLPLSEGLALEARFLGELVVTDVCKNLISLFYLNESNKTDSGVADQTSKPRPIQEVGVVGAGLMGSGIAQVVSYRDIPVRMKDVSSEAVTKGLESARKIYLKAAKRSRISEEELDRKMSLISGTLDYRDFNSVDLVIEAAVEDMAIKQSILGEFEKVAKGEAIFATNTSSLSVTELATASAKPQNIGGMHFFNPVHRMPLVEVIAGEQTSDITIATLVAFSKRLGKVPIVVKECPGFVVNRILGPYLNEACLLLEEGNKIDAVDKALLEFGMPMGPFRLFDEIGIDVASKVQDVLQAAFGHRLKPSGVLQRVYQSGRLGRKNKRGFYLQDKKKMRVDHSVYDVIAELRTGPGGATEGEIQDRMLLSMVNEAGRIIEEDIVRKPAHVDLAMIVGTGFPPFRGGLLRFADHLGITSVVDRLERYQNKHGGRFEPAQLLKEMARSSQSFYQS